MSLNPAAVQPSQIIADLCLIAASRRPAPLGFMDHPVFEISPVQHTGLTDRNLLFLPGKRFFTQQHTELNQVVFQLRTDSVPEKPQFAAAHMQIIQFLSGKFHHPYLYQTIESTRNTSIGSG